MRRGTLLKQWLDLVFAIGIAQRYHQPDGTKTKRHEAAEDGKEKKKRHEEAEDKTNKMFSALGIEMSDVSASQKHRGQSIVLVGRAARSS